MKYYHDLFGLEMLQDNDGNMIEVGMLINGTISEPEDNLPEFTYGI